MIPSFPMLCSFHNSTFFFFTTLSAAGKVAIDNLPPRVSKPCNFSGMPEFFICYIHYLFGFSSAFWQEFQLMYRFPCRNHIIFYVICKIFSEKALDNFFSRCYNNSAKARRSAAPSSPPASAKRFYIEGFARRRDVVRCGCCGIRIFCMCNGGALPSAN